ncbi:hypothetical protein D3C86_1366690 [compost metagenome]
MCRRQVDDHRAGFHLRDGFGAQQYRCLAAGNQGGGDDDIGLFRTLMHGLGLTLHPTGRHWACIAANANGAVTLFIGLVGDVNEFGTQGFDLFLHRRANVRSLDHRTQALGRGNGLQASHAGAENQHASGFHGTGSGHQHRHEARVVMSGQQHGLIAGNVGLRGQHIQALGTGSTRRGLEGKGGNAALGHFGDGFVVERIEHAHQNGTVLDLGKFVVARRHDLEDQLRTEGIGSASNSGAGCFISTVSDTGVDAGTALYSDFMTLAHQFLDGFRGSCNPCLARLRFERNTNVHVKSPA